MSFELPNILDFIIFIWLMWCFLRGRHNKIGIEVKKMVNSLFFIAFLTGFSLYEKIKTAVDRALDIGLSHSPMSAWFLGIVISLTLLFIIKKRMAEHLEHRLSSHRNMTTAGQLGLFRGMMVSAALVLFFGYKVHYFEDIIQASWYGKGCLNLLKIWIG